MVILHNQTILYIQIYWLLIYLYYKLSQMSTEGGVKPPVATETKPALTSTTSTPSSTVTTTQSSTPSVTTPKSSSQPLVNWVLFEKEHASQI